MIYAGLHQTPELIVRTAIPKDVDLVSLSYLPGTFPLPNRGAMVGGKQEQERCVRSLL